MRVRNAAAAAVLLLVASAGLHAQSPTPGGMPPPPGMSLAQSAAMRFPQPIRVGDLPGRPLLEPIEAQTVLGNVRSIARDPAGNVVALIELSAWFGVRTRLVAVPIDALVLVGDAVESVAFTPAQLWQLPAADASAATPLAADTTIKVGLAKPSH